MSNLSKYAQLVLWTLVAALFAVCCKGNTPEVQETESMAMQDVRLAPGDYISDSPDNIVEYFESLCSEHGAVVAVHSNDRDDSLQVWQAIRLLDDYAAGRRKYYPAEEVRRALDVLAFELGYWHSHGDYFKLDYADDQGDYEDTNYAEIFFFRFLEQAVRLSPQVDFVTDFHCADGTAGILNYHEWSPNPLYSFLVYPSDSGLRVRMIGEVGDTKIEKLFHLYDEDGREYYLCSNNGSFDDEDGFYAPSFRQYLLQPRADGIDEVASYTGSDFVDDYFEGTIVFNSKQLRWDCCTRNGDTFVRVEGSKSLILTLDGGNSCFSQE